MKVVSFFAGCGGLDLGFRQAGFDVVWANELEPHCRATYLRNHPDTEFVVGDICTIDPASIPDCDGFIGGPPCQSWSVGGKMKGLDDDRGKLFLKYIELIHIKQPKFFVIENVKGMLDDKFKDVFEDFIIRLDQAGYDVKWSLLDSVKFRVPQNRERVFFVGFKKGLRIKYNFPIPTCDEPITIEKAIGDIKEEPMRLLGGKKQTAIDSEKNVDGYSNHEVILSKFGPFYYRGNRRRGWNQPSFTINATADFAPLHPSSPKMMYYGHENWNFQKDKLDQYRRLSVRECARLQTFPDNFIFEYDDIRSAYRMIGNAVPPRLGKELAKSIIRAMQMIDMKENSQGQQIENKSETVLVGYYKGKKHRQMILENNLYYVRSDGRHGSMFKEDCSIVPAYVLIHHKDEAELYELLGEEPVLADASFLKSIGFNVSGNTYLCFRLKIPTQKVSYEQNEIIGQYTPYFTTLDKILNN